MRRIPTIGLCTVVLLLIGARFNSNGVLFAQSPVATANDVDADNPYIRKLVGRLGAADPQERVAAAQEIANLGKWAKPVVPHLIDLLADEAPAKEGNVSSQVRSHVIGMLADLGQPLAGDAMLEGLKHPNRLCRMGVIDVLGNFREERAVPKLVELLGDDDREVGSRAINALAMIGEPAIEPLLETLSSSNASARAFALGALGRLRHAKVVQPVARLLGDDDVAVRTFAIQALEELGYKARSNQENDALLRQLVIDELKSALHTQRIAVRLAAVECATGFYCVDLQAALAE
jgi:HEAT repeat protein